MAAKPLPPPRSRYHAERIREVFTQLDKTGDGALSFLEIKKGLEENDVDWVRFPRSEETPPPPPPSRRPLLAAFSFFFCPLNHFGRHSAFVSRKGSHGDLPRSTAAVGHSVSETRFFYFFLAVRPTAPCPSFVLLT